MHQYSALFKAIDDYVRVEHRCFVSELDPSQTEWVICVRPTNENARTLALTGDVNIYTETEGGNSVH
jgi:hypothetical protein